MVNNRLVNIKIGDLLGNPELFKQIEINLLRKIKKHNVKDYDVKKTMDELKSALKILTPYIAKDTLFLQRLVEKGKKVLFEGAQSVMLDVTQGLVPYVTSSSTVAGAAFVGGDVPPKYHRKTIGVAKAIMSRVGNGPFASEFGKEESENYCMDETHTRNFEQKIYHPEKMLASTSEFKVGIGLRMLGNEYGTVTKRPRRIGALDLVQLGYAAKMNGVDALFLNKCDLLIDFFKTKKQKIPLVTEYSLRGKRIDYIPASNSAYRQIAITTEYLPDFTQKLNMIHSYKELPRQLLTLLKKIEEATSSKIMGIGTGPKREEYILF
jgi:adenylosuccinate synthase